MWEGQAVARGTSLEGPPAPAKSVKIGGGKKHDEFTKGWYMHKAESFVVVLGVNI